jgi:glycosyltransferase involved in cell wall biosynthesis
MAHYYGTREVDWVDCLTDCVPATEICPEKSGRAHRDTIVYGCAGSFVPVKNWELIMQALALHPAGMELRVVHAGSDDGSTDSRSYAVSLLRLRTKLRLERQVEWRGGLKNMREFFDEIDCLVVPSRWEASSVAALEAIAAGVPVLAADERGTADLVRRCQGGWTFPSDSAEALEKEMTKLAAGSELTTWHRNDEALASFAASRVGSAHAEVYRSLV